MQAARRLDLEDSPLLSVPDRLDDLLALEHGDLAPLYEQATVPRLTELDGDLRGRMLAVPGLPEVITTLPRAWARTSMFPWRGKSFASITDDRGTGINRVGSDRLRLFRFTTFVGPSRHDGAPAVQLDYDHRGNPFFIRAIEDELRELRPGLFLGQAWLRTGASKRFVLWFGLQQR